MSYFRNELRRIAYKLDYMGIRVQLRFFPRNRQTVSLYFHNLGNDLQGLFQVADPLNAALLSDVEEIIERFLALGFRSVSPQELSDDSIPKKLLLTLDDGYASNQLLIPILKKYQAKATCFVAGHYSENNESFWWDVVWRQRKDNSSREKIAAENAMIKSLRYADIRAYLVKEFGEKALIPQNEHDSPMSVEELYKASREDRFFIGNHTYHHESLANLTTPEEVMQELAQDDDFFNRHNIVHIPAFAYPYGHYSEMARAAVMDSNIKWAFTIKPTSNSDKCDSSLIGRNAFYPDIPLGRQVDLLRGFSMLALLLGR